MDEARSDSTQGTPAPPSSPAGPPERLRVLAYVVAERAPLYRAIMEVFAEAKLQYVLRLRPEELLERAKRRHGSAFDLDEAPEDALDQLVSWGNLKRTQDTARAQSLAEFARRRSLYQLTPEGEAAQLAVEQVERALGTTGSLQDFMLPAILDELRSLGSELDRAEPDGGVLLASLTNLFGQFASLANNASIFMGSLTDTIEAGDVEEGSFLVYKQAVLAYLDRFLSQLERLAPEIRTAVGELEASGIERLVHLAASADEAPTPDGVADRSPELLGRWEGLRGWFVGDPGQWPTLESLQAAARDAIIRLLAILQRLNDKHYRRIDRAADFIQLARWFERSTESDAHRLWRTAFGLTSARHMSVGSADEGAAIGLSWWDAPPCEIAPRLRTTGRGERTGRAAAIEDHSDAKRELAGRLAQNRMKRTRALASFADRGAVRLSQLGKLDEDRFDVLLEFMGRTLGRSATRGGPVTSLDGSFRVTIAVTPDAPRTSIRTPRGRLTGPDLVFEVEEVPRR